MAPSFLFILVAWFSVSSRAQIFEIPYSDPGKCTSSQYFQFSSMQCVNCGAGQKKSGDGLSCVCQSGYKLVAHSKDDNGPIIQCERCSTDVLNKTASFDGSFCIECPAGVGFDTGTGLCNDCPLNAVPSDRTPDGAKRLTRECIACTADKTTPSGTGEGSYCGRCHDSFIISSQNSSKETCSCSCADCIETGGVCLRSTVIRESNDIYRIGYSGNDKVVSFYFKDNFRAARALCDDKSNLTACQLLGNLCVLLTYNLDVADGSNSGVATDACKEYTKLVESKANSGSVVNNRNFKWPVVMPWLYYDRGNAGDILDKKDITTKFKAGQTLPFTLAEYTLNGSYFGQENGTTSIQLCQDRPTKMAAADKFATTFKYSCSVSVKDLMNKQMLFYDMYLLLGNQKMYPVPVLVDNYENKEVLVNQETDKTKWQLTRRFFLVDNDVGRTSAQEKLKYLRYAESIKLHVRLRSSDGEIYPPLLKVKYKTKDVSDKLVVNTGSVQVSFAVSYEMDLTKITKDTEVRKYSLMTSYI